ncbi:MAG: hypothetical protein ACK5PZ_10725, partial [Pirellula sp.]
MVSIMTSVGGYRVCASRCHLLTRAALIIRHELDSLGDLYSSVFSFSWRRVRTGLNTETPMPRREWIR